MNDHSAAAKTLEDNIRNSHIPQDHQLSPLNTLNTGTLQSCNDANNTDDTVINTHTHTLFPSGAAEAQDSHPALQKRIATIYRVCEAGECVCVCVSDLNLTFLAHRK